MQTPFYIEKLGRQNWVYFDLRTDVIRPSAATKTTRTFSAIAEEARAVRNAPVAATPKKRAGPEGSQGSRARRARSRPRQGGDDEGLQGSDVTNSPSSQASTFSLASEWRETFEELEQEAGSGEAEDQEGGHEGAD